MEAQSEQPAGQAPTKNRGGGTLGNRNAAKGRRAAAALAQAVEDADKAPNCKYSLRKIVQKLLRLAADGDMEAIKVVFDRMDGKALQTLDITHNKGPSLLHAEQARDLATAFLESKRISDAAKAEALANNVIDVASKP